MRHVQGLGTFYRWIGAAAVPLGRPETFAPPATGAHATGSDRAEVVGGEGAGAGPVVIPSGRYVLGTVHLSAPARRGCLYRRADRGGR